MEKKELVDICFVNNDYEIWNTFKCAAPWKVEVGEPWYVIIADTSSDGMNYFDSWDTPEEDLIEFFPIAERIINDSINEFGHIKVWLEKYVVKAEWEEYADGEGEWRYWVDSEDVDGKVLEKKIELEDEEE